MALPLWKKKKRRKIKKRPFRGEQEEKLAGYWYSGLSEDQILKKILKIMVRINKSPI